MEKNKCRTWADIHLDHLTENYRQICDRVHTISPETKVLSVVKSNAYGHGAVQAAKALSAEGTDFFAVATALEAVELREAGIEEPILVLGYVDPEEVKLAVQYDFAIALCDSASAQRISAAVQDIADAEIRVHIAINTGMTRIGFESDEPHENAEEIVQAISLPGIRAEGIFTHFAVADIDDGKAYTEQQAEKFAAICQQLDDKGIDLQYRHCANSAAILQYPDTFARKLPSGRPVFNMVRAGIILYGYYPDAQTAKTVPLKPVMTVYAHVAQVRETKEGSCVSYGRTYCTEQPTKLAVVTIGYADGYHRAGSGRAVMQVQGKAVPVVGRICMDMCMLDVSGLEVKPGDIVTVFGDEAVTADTVADAAGTISYEVTCAMSGRVPRFYSSETV